MYVEDLKKDFYDALSGNRVLVLVQHDVDALCACLILQGLLRCEGRAHSVVGVRGATELQSAFTQHCAPDLRSAVLINCGGTLDLVELLQPPQDVVLFVLDSHRPTDVCNVYSNGQVRLVGRDPDEGVPDFDDIFREDESEESGGSGEEELSGDDDEEGGEGEGKENGVEETRLQRLERRLEERRTKRRDRIAWERNRDTLMFNYTQFSFYGRSSAARMLEVAWSLSRDTWEAVWWAGVGVTEQLVLDKGEAAAYLLEAGTLQGHASRLQGSGANPGAAAVSLEADVRLSLYRHWSVEQALRHSAITWGRLKLWGARGETRLQKLLADMGLPLRQARQPFASAEPGIRGELLPALERLRDKYGLRDLHYLAFCLRRGYGPRLCAADAVYAALALLEGEGGGGLERALRSLQPEGGREELRRGLEAAKLRMQSAAHAVQQALQGHLMLSAGPFLYLLLPESGGQWGPQWLGVMARWLQQGAQGSAGGRPLLLGAPPHDGQRLILGVPPLAKDSTRNLFGKAFEQAAIRSHSSVSLDNFDSSVIFIQEEHVGKFLDALTTLLT